MFSFNIFSENIFSYFKNLASKLISNEFFTQYFWVQMFNNDVSINYSLKYLEKMTPKI